MAEDRTPTSSPKRAATFPTPEWTKASLNDTIDFPDCGALSNEELMFYSLMEIVFPENTYNNLHRPESYQKIQRVIYDVLGKKYSVNLLRKYFSKKRDGRPSSKERFRWIEHENQVSWYIEKNEDVLTKLLNGESASQSQKDSLKDITVDLRITTKELLLFFDTQVKMVVKGCWGAEICEGILKIFRFINSRGYAAIEYQVNNNLECTLYAERDIVKQHLDVFEIPSKVVTFDCLKQACIAISKLSICVGASIHDISDVVAAADNGVLYRNKANEMQATIKTLLSESSTVLKSAHCTGLIFRDDLVATKVTCGSCTKAKTYLKKRNSSLQNIENKERNGRLSYYDKDDLIDLVKNQKRSLLKMKKQIERLEKHQSDMTKVGKDTNSDLAYILKNLETGLQNRNSRHENPICKWEKTCRQTFEEVEDLYEHCLKTHMPETESDTCPSERDYKCLWSKCTKSFTKIRQLKEHLRVHTGSASDEFLTILLKDQARALNVPSRSMKWHPLVIKWCLRTWTQSHSLYNHMRDANFLILPTGRTLSDYKNFNHPSSGWHESHINCMVEAFRVKCAPERAKVGGLYFDELKIKEGLVWDPNTWEILGFIDLDISEKKADKSEDLLATHILQFFYKSLFFKFDYPCAYILTNNITAEDLNRHFWVGVSYLEERHFNILLACCDGASENRKMMNLNMVKDQSFANNPFSGMPLFFISDPPHLMKKLRNNLYKSGYITETSRFTRHLEIENKKAEWEHIYSVFQRELKRFQPVTKLSHEAVHLDSLNKMRVKLAVNTLHTDVAVEMNNNVPHNTSATQMFIENCVKLWSSLNSDKPLKCIDDHRIAKLDEVLHFFKLWHAELEIKYPQDKKSVTDGFITWQTFSDLKLTITNFKELLTYISENLSEKYGQQLYIIPNRINQDIVESFFSKQRQLCGGSQNMTSHLYGYNINSCLTISSSTLVKKKQTNVLEVNECQQLVKDSSILPKRKLKDNALKEVPCPLNI